MRGSLLWDRVVIISAILLLVYGLSGLLTGSGFLFVLSALILSFVLSFVLFSVYLGFSEGSSP